MKKVLKLFVWLLSTLTILNVYNSVFAVTPGCNPVQQPDGTIKEVCPDDNPSGETPKDCPNWCCGIKLNTNFPIIGNCIETSKDAKTNPTNAFPVLIGDLTKVVMSLIFVVCFILIIVAGIMRAWAWEDSNKVKKAKDLLLKVAIKILLLWFSGAILKLINPNFFG